MCKLQGSWHVISGSHLAEKVLHNKCESGDQFEKAGRSLLSNLSCFSRFFFPFVFFGVFPCRWCRQRHSDDPLMTLIVMYFNNSLTIWNTEMNAIDKEKNLSNRLMERARGSCKEENMTRKAAKSSRVMHWTRQSNEMNNQNSSKMRRISVCLYWTLISHYWPLLIIIQ